MKAPAGQDPRQRAVVAYMAREDHTAVMRDVIRARLEREIDPDGMLSPAERAKLVGPAAKRLAAELNAAKAHRCAVQDRPAPLLCAVPDSRGRDRRVCAFPKLLTGARHTMARLMMWSGGSEMERWRAAVLAALTAALPVLASDLHGWLHALLAGAIGSVAVLALAQKKFSMHSGIKNYNSPY